MAYFIGWRRAAFALVSLGVALAASDAKAACSSGLACELCDVSGYSPTQLQPPVGPSTGACTTSDIQNFATACFGGSATQQTCNSWQSSAPSGCVSCVLTTQSATTWGPLVCTSTSCSLNTGGCVDLALQQTSQEKSNSGSGSCGDLISASYGCQDYACSTCPTTDGPPTSFDQCAQSAVANECASYVTPVNSTTGPCAAIAGDAGAGPAAACFPQTDQDVPAFVAYFCGGNTTPPPDGGTSPDGGTTKSDAGSPTDGGKSDGGTSYSSKGGCHCGIASSESSTHAGALLGLVGLCAFVARRRRTRS